MLTEGVHILHKRCGGKCLALNFQPRLHHWAKSGRFPERTPQRTMLLFGLACCDPSYVPNSLVHTAQGPTPTTPKMEMWPRCGWDADRDADMIWEAAVLCFPGLAHMRNVRISQWDADCDADCDADWGTGCSDLTLGTRLRGRTATQCSKNGFEKVLERVLRRGSAMGFTVKKGSQKGSQKGFWEGGFQKVPRRPPWRVRRVRPSRHSPYHCAPQIQQWVSHHGRVWHK